MLAGLRSLIDPSKIEVDDSFKVTGGLDDQIEGLKTSYKDAFSTPKNVSMGNTVSKANTVGTPAKQYSSSEIDKMSIKDVMADIDNVVASLSNIK
jgi:archaellum component FlaC